MHSFLHWGGVFLNDRRLLCPDLLDGRASWVSRLVVSSAVAALHRDVSAGGSSLSAGLVLADMVSGVV